MAQLSMLDRGSLQKLEAELKQRYDDFQARKLNLDMTRGKPCAEQLDLALGMLDCVDANHFQRLRWHRLPQLWRAGRHPGGQGALWRVLERASRAGYRRRQLQPEYDVRHHRSRHDAGRRGWRQALGPISGRQVPLPFPGL